jgi:hypothetical protein
MSETRIVESGKDVSFFDDSPTPTTLNNPQYVACLTSQYLYIQYFPITHYKLKGKVVHGFGRGSKLLGFPTANLDPQAFKDTFKGVDRGVFFGYAKISAPASSSDAAPVDEGVFKAMLSLGTNPHFETTEDTLEAYIDHDYGMDFYGYDMTLIIWYVGLLSLSNVHPCHMDHPLAHVTHLFTLLYIHFSPTAPTAVRSSNMTLWRRSSPPSRKTWTSATLRWTCHSSAS